MSGICGIVRLDGSPAEPRDLERQIRRLQHRGPDRVARWCEGTAAMAHLMMRITREDSRDVQPLSRGALTLVADLRLDNREELADALGVTGEALPETADSALLLEAWCRWGADCVERLIGDFAIAAWDADARTLTLARDHMGQRHLFFHQSERFFAFATELTGLWALPDVPRELDTERLVRKLLFEDRQEPGATDHVGIRAVPGGRVMTLGADGSLSSRCYWEPHADRAHLGRDEAYYVAAYRRVFSEAVACRLRRGIAPPGLMMGGGFDSGGICAVAGPALAESGQRLVAVSSVMPEAYRGPIRHARKWVESFRRHMPYLDVRYVTREGIDTFSFLETSFLTSECRHGTSQYATQEIFRALRDAGARTVMDGHGGNYTLNPIIPDSLPRLLRKGAFREFAHEFAAMRRHFRQSFAGAIYANVLRRMLPRRIAMLLTRRRYGLPLFGPTVPLSREIIRTRVRGPARDRVARWARLPKSESMRTIQRLQQGYPAQGFAVSAAQHGLEFTQPFHDKRVIELALAIPERLYTRHGKTRHLARTALQDLYPPEFADRPSVNFDMMPDFLAMSKRVEPRMLAEIDRMEAAGQLSRYFDFDRMRRMITRRRPDQHESGAELDARQAHRTFLMARYIEWFAGRNG